MQITSFPLDPKLTFASAEFAHHPFQILAEFRSNQAVEKEVGCVVELGKTVNPYAGKKEGQSGTGAVEDHPNKQDGFGEAEGEREGGHHHQHSGEKAALSLGCCRIRTGLGHHGCTLGVVLPHAQDDERVQNGHRRAWDEEPQGVFEDGVVEAPEVPIFHACWHASFRQGNVPERLHDKHVTLCCSRRNDYGSHGYQHPRLGDEDASL